ncbi:hypothetical protein RCL1_008915 [Eukaryota sp. TZLM3-RCL]
MLQKVSANNKTELVMVMTDLSNAFGSVRHSLIIFALDYYGFDKAFIDMVTNMYNGLRFSVRLPARSLVVDQQIGVFQGDVLSPALFSIFVNLILEPLGTKSMTSKFGALIHGTSRTTSIAFADDINLLVKSTEAAQTLLNVFCQSLFWSKCLSAAPEEFGLFSIKKCDKLICCSDPKLYFDEVPIHFLDNPKKHFRLLGQQVPLQTEDKVIERICLHKLLYSNINNKLPTHRYY